jgi:3-oxoadipate enol-lactonase
VSLRTALLAPERVRAIAVLGSSASAETDAQKATFLEMHSVFAARGRNGPPQEVLDTFSHICFGPNFNAERWKASWRRWPAKQALLALQALVERDDLVERLSEITALILVMHGAADNSYSPSHGQMIASSVPGNSSYVLVDGGAHFLSLTEPNVVNAVLANFLSKHLHGSGSF